jgi:hypothetical protein
MFKGIIFKEWIKLKWFLILYEMFSILVIGYIFLKVRHDFLFNEPKSYWYSILFQGFQYFKYLKYIPLAGGLLVAAAQFFPETVNKRIKLTFHLPREENGILLQMMGIGSIALLAGYLIVLLLFLIVSNVYFPAEIISAAVNSVIPWFLSGLAAYFLAALVILEPVWLFRVLYFLASCAIIPLFLKPSVSGGYATLNPYLGGMVVLLSVSLLFSGYRFRKGEM